LRDEDWLRYRTLEAQAQVQQGKDLSIDLALLTTTFNLREEFDNELIESVVDLTSTGVIVFHGAQTHQGTEGLIQVKGTWTREEGKILKMIVERQYQGKLSLYSVRTFYIGSIGSSQGRITCDGVCCDEGLCNVDDEAPPGRFTLAALNQEDSNNVRFSFLN